MRTSKFITVTAFTSAVMLLSAAFAIAKPPTDGPNKVWICHFEDHTAFTPWTGAGVLLDGDYVVAYNNTGDSVFPGQNNIGYCESRGGHLILVSVNSLGTADNERGHAPQLMDRIADYPLGYKG